MEESLQARVSLEQIFSLPELKVPAPHHAVTGSRSGLFSVYLSFLGTRALPKSPSGDLELSRMVFFKSGF